MRAKPRDSGRNAQARRILSILRELNRAGSFSLAQLAQRFGTNERTIRRDLEALQEVGFPIVADAAMDGRRKRWKLDAGLHARRLNSLVDQEQYLALRFAMGQGGATSSDASVFGALEDLHQKIEKAIGPRGRAQLRAIDQAFLSYDKHAYRQAAPDVLWLLVTAIGERRLCQVTYAGAQHAGRARTFIVLPLRVFAHQGAAHLMCHVPKHQSYLSLNLQRMKSVKTLEQCSEVPADFDPERLENAAFGVHVGGEPTRYVLRFAREVATYIRERIWHPSQELCELPGGGVELRFSCGASWEVSAWVASWRHWVEALEPVALRGELRALGKLLRQRYARP